MTHPKHYNFIEGNWDSISGIRRFSHEAMATTFEIITISEDERYARQAARAAFDELDRLEADLSRFIENSDISRINNLPANQPLIIGPAAFECLQHSKKMYDETNGAFDVTVGWHGLPARGVHRSSSIIHRRTKDEGQGTRDEMAVPRMTGTYLIRLNEAEHTVQLLTSPVQIDLGGIGKGFAVDRMAELLREWSIKAALISGGYSSILALDAPDKTNGWPVTLSNPNHRKQMLARLNLQNRALGASGIQKGGHIIDPRTARPVQGKLAAWVCVDDAVTADALSTAFMVMSPDEIEKYCEQHPEVQALVILQQEKQQKILRLSRWETIEQN